MAHLLIELGCEHDDDGWPITQADGRTSLAGVFAGNVAIAA
jgi:thioredoxin reductase